ncbi:hypothetical protein IW150_006318 [Coemansia sp. RSA 2607]|nr:hypothetical protein IW150_006318 [Coemansia sp. RSA 2607]
MYLIKKIGARGDLVTATDLATTRLDQFRDQGRLGITRAAWLPKGLQMAQIIQIHRHLLRRHCTRLRRMHEYEGTHSRESSVGAQYYSGSVGTGDSNTGMGGGYRSSRVHSPDITMQQQPQQQRDVLPPPPPPPELILPPLVHGTDLFIARMPEAEEWIEAREKAREQAKRILETSANARRTAFDLVHVGWNVLKADSQVQLAVWQLERAEGGLGLADRSLLETEGIGEI